MGLLQSWLAGGESHVFNLGGVIEVICTACNGSRQSRGVAWGQL